MIHMRTIYPKSVPKITGTTHKSISNLYLSNSFKLRQLILLCFIFIESKTYVTSYVDEDVFKLLYDFFLHQLSSIIASAIGARHANSEYIFVPPKLIEATLIFFNSPLSIIARYCQKNFYIGTWTNRCWVIFESAICSFMNSIGIFFIMFKAIT